MRKNHIRFPSGKSQRKDGNIQPYKHHSDIFAPQKCHKASTRCNKLFQLHAKPPGKPARYGESTRTGTAERTKHA